MNHDPAAEPISRSGLSEIDLQHRQIAAMIETLIEFAQRWALHNGDSQKAWEGFHSALSHLFVCYVEHFQFEENLLQSCRYPNLTDHRHDHTRILSSVAQCTHAMIVGMKVDLLLTAQGLAASFQQHELDADFAYMGFLNQPVAT